MARLRIRHPGDPLHEKTQPPAMPNMDRTSPSSAASKIETSVSTTTTRSSLSATYAGGDKNVLRRSAQLGSHMG